jgi:hypothetical protein
MSQDPFNFNFPFVNMMPEDMGDSNLMLNSMKMMGQAWQNFTSAAPQASAMAMDPNELDKRIEELKSVESWLKLNLSMLSNSIHSLEIQKANLEHFNSMMEIMSEPMKAAQSSSMFTAAQPQPDDKAKPAAEPATTEEPSEATGETTESASDEQTSFAETSGLVQDQALNWFSLLGDQFKNIVASVAANTPTETSEEKTDEQPIEKPQEQTEKSEATAKKTTTRAAKKASTPKKTTAKKATAKKSSGSIAKKTVATKKAATKKADDQ